MTENLIIYAFQEAMVTALAEAKTTPIALGEQVGHTDFATYGTKSGALVAYEADEVVVETTDGEKLRWKAEGTVNIKRVYVLADQYATRLEQLSEVVGMMEMLGVSPAETLNEILGPPSDEPTPGCDCPFCAQYTPEQHEAARLKQAAEAEATSATNGGTPAEEAAHNETAPAETTGKFPYNEFLKMTEGQ